MQTLDIMKNLQILLTLALTLLSIYYITLQIIKIKLELKKEKANNHKPRKR